MQKCSSIRMEASSRRWGSKTPPLLPLRAGADHSPAGMSRAWLLGNVHMALGFANLDGAAAQSGDIASDGRNSLLAHAPLTIFATTGVVCSANLHSGWARLRTARDATALGGYWLSRNCVTLLALGSVWEATMCRRRNEVRWLRFIERRTAPPAKACSMPTTTRMDVRSDWRSIAMADC